MTQRLVALFLALALSAPADTLTLRSGASITGNWFGIDRGNIKFQANGEVQQYRTSDVASVVFAADSPLSPAPTSAEASAGTLEQQLKSQYQLTTLAADYSNIVTIGSTLILQKRGFSAGALSNKLPTKYTYKDGQIKPDAIGATRKIYDRATSLGDMIPGVKGRVPDTSRASDAAGTWRPFVNGERLYVTQIAVQKSDDSIVFDLISDAFENEGRYQGSLAFQFPAGTLGSANLARVQPMIAEVFAIEPSPDQPAAPQTSQIQFSQIRADAPLPPDTPPPPPPATPLTPDTPPAGMNFKPGSTVAEVTATLGQPVKVVTFGGKQIYEYKNLKVTFVDGKMTDIQ